MITLTDLLLENYPIPELSDDYTLPEKIWPKPDQLGLPLVTRAAFVFDRKGYLSLDELGRDRNPAYGKSEDSILEFSQVGY